MRLGTGLCLAGVSLVMASCDGGGGADENTIAMTIFRSQVDSVTLDWADAVEGEDGYKVYRSDDDGAFVEIDDLAPDADTYDDATVAAGVKYTYYVAAYTGTAETDTSNRLVADYVKILTPDGGEVLTIDDVYDITYETNLTGNAADFVISLSTAGPALPVWEWDILHFSLSPNPFPWKVGYRVDSGDPSQYNTDKFVTGSETQCVVRIDHYTESHICDVGDDIFTVQP